MTHIKVDENKYGWYIWARVDDTGYYLHNDGTWRKSTALGEKYTGYYATKELAEETLKKFPAPPPKK